MGNKKKALVSQPSLTIEYEVGRLFVILLHTAVMIMALI